MRHGRVGEPISTSTDLTKGERTRAAIISAAFELFISKGYHATSMRQIADEAGLAPGGLYNHFAGKEEIFVAMLMERHPFLEIMPALQTAKGKTVEELVRDAAAQMIEILGERHDVLNLMFVELVEFEGRHVPQLFEAFFPPMMEFAQRFTQASGPLRPIPLPILLRAFIGLFFSYFITEMLIGSQLPPEFKENAFDRFVDIYLNGILA
jgi:AcrR family transcriptional regulator